MTTDIARMARRIAVIAWGNKAGIRLERGLCPRCGDDPNVGLRDEISRREAKISQLCQSCQDELFKKI